MNAKDKKSYGKFVDRVAETNVNRTIDNIFKKSDFLRMLVYNGHIRIEGAMYNVNNGSVRFLNDDVV